MLLSKAPYKRRINNQPCGSSGSEMNEMEPILVETKLQRSSHRADNWSQTLFLFPSYHSKTVSVISGPQSSLSIRFEHKRQVRINTHILTQGHKQSVMYVWNTYDRKVGQPPDG